MGIDLDKWAEATIKTETLVLDPNNPRIDLPQNASEQDIIEQLLKHHKVLDLAKEIVNSGGLLPGGRIITYQFNGEQVVLEGNRRTCACKLLLDPTLIPESFQNSFPRADSEDLILEISQLKADIAPTREAAQPILTKRHSQREAVPWTPFANVRRVANLYNLGLPVDSIVESLGQSASKVKERIREFNIYGMAKEKIKWSQREKDFLTSPEINFSSYTRFFNLKGVKERLRLSYKDGMVPESKLEEIEFLNALECITRGFFIPEKGKEKPWFNTRTKPEDVFKKCNIKEPVKNTAGKTPTIGGSGDPGASGTPPIAPRNPGPEPGGQLPTPQIFFEKLSYTVQDPNLVQMATEIRMINHNRMPVSSTLLLRSLLEASLVHQLNKQGKWDKLLRSDGMDPGLEKILGFAADHKNKVFKEKGASDAIKTFLGSGYKMNFDLIVHGKWANANPKTLEQAAAILRQLISYILNEEKRSWT